VQEEIWRVTVNDKLDMSIYFAKIFLLEDINKNEAFNKCIIKGGSSGLLHLKKDVHQWQRV